jgi:hypothetical protein
MSNVAEGCASGRWIRTIDQEDAFSDFGQRPGNGTAHNASANDGNIGRRRKAPAPAVSRGNIGRGRQVLAPAADRGNIVLRRNAIPRPPTTATSSWPIFDSRIAARN